MHEIPALIDLADEMGVDVFAVGRYCPTSTDKAYDKDIHIPPPEYREFLQACWEKYEQHKDSKTTFQLKDHLWSLFLWEKGLLKIPADSGITDGCNCGRNHMTILPNCGKCELKGVCRGCPAVTYGYTHDIYGADPQCWKEV